MMKEIRIAWSIAGQKNAVGEPVQAGEWFPANHENLSLLTLMVNEGNLNYGEGTHWVEERES